MPVKIDVISKAGIVKIKEGGKAAPINPTIPPATNKPRYAPATFPIGALTLTLETFAFISF